MGTTTLERPQVLPVKAEWNHSCTSQCSTPCGAASELTIPQRVEMTGTNPTA